MDPNTQGATQEEIRNAQRAAVMEVTKLVAQGTQYEVSDLQEEGSGL